MSLSIIQQKADFDSFGGSFSLRAVDDEGSTLNTYPRCDLVMSDLGVTDADATVGRIARFRAFTVCDSSGAVKSAMILSSEPE